VVGGRGLTAQHQGHSDSGERGGMGVEAGGGLLARGDRSDQDHTDGVLLSGVLDNRLLSVLVMVGQAKDEGMTIISADSFDRIDDLSGGGVEFGCDKDERSSPGADHDVGQTAGDVAKISGYL
jgi:hypothetical protein